MGPSFTVNPAAVASTATIVDISCSRALVSRGPALVDLSCESFACTHGCRDMWTFAGKEAADILATTEVITTHVSHSYNREVGEGVDEGNKGRRVYIPK